MSEDATEVVRLEPVVRLLITSECVQLCLRLSWLGDKGDADGYADCYTDDGCLDRAGQLISGKEALRAYIKARPAGVSVRHIISPPFIMIHQLDQATGTSPAIVYRRDTSGAEPRSQVADIRDEYCRTATGWRVRKRIARAAF